MARELDLRVTADASQAIAELKKTDDAVRNVAVAAKDNLASWTLSDKAFTDMQARWAASAKASDDAAEAQKKAWNDKTVPMSVMDLNAKVMTMTEGVKLAGQALAVFGAARVVFDAIAYGDKLESLSKATGSSVENLQKLAYAAVQSNTTLDAVSNGLITMQQRLATNKDARNAFSELGLEVDKLIKLDPVNFLYEFSDKLRAMPTHIDAVKAAWETLGRGNKELLPLMLSDIRGLGDGHRILDKETTEGLSTFSSAWETASLTFKSEIGTMLGKFGPWFAMFTDWTENFETKLPSAVKSLGQSLNDVMGKVVAPGAPLQKVPVFLTDATKAMEDYEKEHGKLSDVMKKYKDEQDDINRQVDQWNKHLNAQADILTGRALTAKLIDLNAQIERAGGLSEITAYEAQRLGKMLQVDVSNGAVLATQALRDLWRMQTTLDILTRTHTATQKDLVKAFGGTETAITSIHKPVSVMTDDFMKFVHSDAPSVVKALTSIGDEYLVTKTTLDDPPPTEAWVAWESFIHGVKDRITSAMASGFTDILTGAASFKEGFADIWGNLKDALRGIVDDIIKNVLGRLITGMLNVLTGAGSFASAFSGIMGGIGKGAGAAGAGGTGAGLSAGTVSALTTLASSAAAIGLVLNLGALLGNGYSGTGVIAPPSDGPYVGNGYLEDGSIDPLGPYAGQLPGYAGGTMGQYLNFGAGTPVMLHGQERVMTADERDTSSGVTINFDMRGAYLPDRASLQDFAERLMPALSAAGARYRVA